MAKRITGWMERATQWATIMSAAVTVASPAVPLALTHPWLVFCGLLFLTVLLASMWYVQARARWKRVIHDVRLGPLHIKNRSEAD